MAYVVWLSEAQKGGHTGPAGSLVAARAAGIAVPSGFLVTQEAFARFVEAARLDEHVPYLFAEEQTAQARAERMQQFAHGEPIPDDVRGEVADGYDTLCDGRGEPVVLAAQHAQMRSASDRDEFWREMAGMWARGFSAQYFSEIAPQGWSLPRAEVLVQRAVQARKSVRAQANGDGAELFASFGLPQGCLPENADRIRVQGLNIAREGSTKRYAMHYEITSGRLEREDLDEEEREAGVLNDSEVRSLMPHVHKLNALFPGATGVWCLERDAWWLVRVEKAASAAHQEMLPKAQERLLLENKATLDDVFQSHIAQNPAQRELLERLREDVHSALGINDKDSAR